MLFSFITKLGHNFLSFTFSPYREKSAYQAELERKLYSCGNTQTMNIMHPICLSIFPCVSSSLTMINLLLTEQKPEKINTEMLSIIDN